LLEHAAALDIKMMDTFGNMTLGGGSHTKRSENNIAGNLVGDK